MHHPKEELFMNIKVRLQIQTCCVALFIAIILCFSYAEMSCASFTLEDEKRLGKEFYDDICKKEMLLDNPDLTSYVNEIGRLIVAQGDRYPLDFTFSIIKNSGINAFATPGGYVYVYTGLIELSENEGQLAGVLAHEIAHIKARHIARTIEKSR